MGQTLRQLSTRPLPQKTIFNNRFVIDVCEKIHFHYRNLRIVQSLSDWESMSRGLVDAYNRWLKLGEPANGQRHIELCRKTVAMFPEDKGIEINLNKNLYKPNEGRIFSEGAEFSEPEYIHFKIRDIRLEMPVEEFLTLADAVAEAREALCQKSLS